MRSAHDRSPASSWFGPSLSLRNSDVIFAVLVFVFVLVLILVFNFIVNVMIISIVCVIVILPARGPISTLQISRAEVPVPLRLVVFVLEADVVAAAS